MIGKVSRVAISVAISTSALVLALDDARADQVLRVASTNNCVATDVRTTNAGRTRNLVRWPIRIGSGNFSELVLSFNNWYLNSNSTVTNNSTSYDIIRASIQSDDGSVILPVSFDIGQTRSRTIMANKNDVQSNPISKPSGFQRGDLYWLKMEVSADSQRFPFGACKSTEWYEGSQSIYADPATTVSSVDETGLFTTTGGSPTSALTGVSPIVLGRFAEGDPATWMAVGDSIFLVLEMP